MFTAFKKNFCFVKYFQIGHTICMSYSPILLKDIQEGFKITEDDYSICLYGREQFEYYLKNILIQSDCDLFLAPSSASGVAPCLSQESTGNF